MAKKLSDITKKFDRLERFLKNDTKTIIGVEAVKHFKASFRNQGFTDKTLEKWEDVKRRDPQSVWYGFEYGSKSPVPSNHPKRGEAKSKWKRRKEDSITNFGNNATKRAILTGKSKGALLNSIGWNPTENGVVVYAKTPYAEVQNKGGKIKVFGKKEVDLKPRQFMGDSAVLRKTINDKISERIKNILK